MKDTFEVRDMRSKEKFFVNDEYLNGYARLCGPNATLVYLCLCRHADRHQESFPSVNMMADKTGVSRDSIMRGIRTLIEWNIVSKERERTKDAKWLNNRYVLLDKSVWKSKPSRSQPLGSQVAHSVKSQVAHSDSKDTHTEKDTHLTVSDAGIAGIEEVIEMFSKINPSYKKFYNNKTQRSAISRLISQHGIVKVRSSVEVALLAFGKEYAPTITTPLQLEDKLAALGVWYRRTTIRGSKVML